MTTGQVTKTTDIQAAIANITANKSDMVSPMTNGIECNFKNFLPNTGSESTKLPVEIKKTSSEISEAATKGLKNGNSERILSKSKEKAKTADNNTEKITSDIKNAVKEELKLTDEEFDSKLNELGLTVIDLANPNNMATFIAAVNDTDVTALVTNPELTEQFNLLTNEIAGIINQASEEMQLPVEDVINTIKNKTDNFASELNSKEKNEAYVNNQEQKTTVVTDAETGKQIKITIENNRVSNEETSFTRQPDLTENTTDNNTSESNHENEKENGNGKDSIAGQFLQNMAASVDDVIGASNDFTSYATNGIDIVNQIVDAVKVNVTSDTKSMELQLNPENLGKINLNVTTKDGIVTATITTQNETVRAEIAQQLSQLKDALNNQGLKVQNVEVAVANQGFNAQTENGKHGEEQQNTPKRKKFRNIDEIMPDEFLDSAEKEMMEAQGNSVSYTA